MEWNHLSPVPFQKVKLLCFYVDTQLNLVRILWTVRDRSEESFLDKSHNAHAGGNWKVSGVRISLRYAALEKVTAKSFFKFIRAECFVSLTKERLFWTARQNFWFCIRTPTVSFNILVLASVSLERHAFCISHKVQASSWNASESSSNIDGNCESKML